MKRKIRGVVSFVVLGSIVMMGVVLTACGVNWFPKCDDPKHPCPPVEPDYPATSRSRDAGHNVQDSSVSD